MNIKTISGGYQVPDDSHLGLWQQQQDQLDHDQHLVPIACQHIKPGMTVLDAGAFNGDHSYAYRKAAGYEGRVFSIEANPFTFGMLKFNMKLQTAIGPYGAFTLAESVCLRAGIDSGTGNMGCSIIPSDNLGASHIENGTVGTERMNMISIDFISQVFDVKFGFVKLDIEGFEYDALSGAENVLQTQKPTLMIEMCASNLARQEAKYSQIYELLAIHGYKWEILQPQCSPESEQYDIIAVPG